MRLLLSLLLALAPDLPAAFHAIGGAQVEAFGASKTWQPVDLRVLYQDQPEGLQVAALGLKPGVPLNARVQVDQLPGYSLWLAQRQAQGGAAWAALQGLLQEAAGQPVVVLTLRPLPAQGPLEVLLGLRHGARFELYATFKGRLAPAGRSLIFSPESVAFEKASARLAWQLLEPLARAQARGQGRRAAGQNP